MHGILMKLCLLKSLLHWNKQGWTVASTRRKLQLAVEKLRIQCVITVSLAQMNSSPPKGCRLQNPLQESVETMAVQVTTGLFLSVSLEGKHTPSHKHLKMYMFAYRWAHSNTDKHMHICRCSFAHVNAVTQSHTCKCMDVCTFTRVDTLRHTQTLAHANTWYHVHTHVNSHACKHIHTEKHAFVYNHTTMQGYIHVNKHLHTKIPKHICMHALTHSQTCNTHVQCVQYVHKCRHI